MKTVGLITCMRCHYEWLPRVLEKPAMCPRCKDRNYDKPRKKKRAKR